MTKKVPVYILLFLMIFGSSFADQPFNYDLHLLTIPGKSSRVMITAHGMGGNYTIANTVKVDGTLVTFNFPDYDYGQRELEPEATTFGTIDELLPLLYVMKKTVVTDSNQEIDLYGFSAGGGAIINAIGVLNTNRYDENLKTIGISQSEKNKILQAIQKGTIILDAPLKSVREIIDFRGSSPELEIFVKRYEANDMEPINALKYIEGLSLNVIISFQDRDEIISNRDDELFFSRLKMCNPNGRTELLTSNDGGHAKPRCFLWFYLQKIYPQKLSPLN